MTPNETAVRDAGFRTTCWTEILLASNEANFASDDAFGRLYSDYWPPIYAFLRRRGFNPEEAEDIAQDFFLRLMQKQSLKNLAREGGRFRSFLLAALRNFLANEWDYRQAQKRGGGVKPLSLDSAGEEGRYLALQLPADATPESLFEKRWVLNLLDRVLDRIRTVSPAADRPAFFEDIRPHLQSDSAGLPYAAIAARHEMSESAVKVSVHRLRQRYAAILREEIARTVSNETEVEEELRHLIRVVTD